MVRQRSSEKKPDTYAMAGGFTAEVTEVVDEYSLVINRGGTDGVHIGQVFLVYGLSGQEPAAAKGHEKAEMVEIIKGTGEVVKAFSKKAIIRSTRITSPLIVKRRSPLVFLGVGPEIKTGKETEDQMTLPKRR